MNSYRIIKFSRFPENIVDQPLEFNNCLELPGITPQPKTIITFINENYSNFELYSIEHTMEFKEYGIAYGYINDTPERMEFNLYQKPYTINCYLDRVGSFLLLSAPSFVTKDFIKVLKKQNNIPIEVTEYNLNLNRLKAHGQEYLGAWFRNISTRVSASALFGSDLMNEPYFEQFLEDGAKLSSVIIPFKNINIQINNEGCVSSKQIINSKEQELAIIRSLKEDLIDRISIE